MPTTEMVITRKSLSRWPEERRAREWADGAIRESQRQQALGLERMLRGERRLPRRGSHADD